MGHENFWFRTLFKLKLYEVSGESFQRLFNDVANYRYPSFQAVAPYGNLGDGGNDGWIADENRYCQVYGALLHKSVFIPIVYVIPLIVKINVQATSNKIPNNKLARIQSILKAAGFNAVMD